jgi:hypothetical protein
MYGIPGTTYLTSVLFSTSAINIHIGEPHLTSKTTYIFVCYKINYAFTCFSTFSEFTTSVWSLEYNYNKLLLNWYVDSEEFIWTKIFDSYSRFPSFLTSIETLYSKSPTTWMLWKRKKSSISSLSFSLLKFYDVYPLAIESLNTFSTSTLNWWIC